MLSESLHLEDLNTLIKYFANQIYQRLLELQDKTRIPTKQAESQIFDQEIDFEKSIDNILIRYDNYTTKSQLESEYVKRMMQRILQIFGFYKWKCRNQSILNHVQRQISSKLNLILNDSCVNVGRISKFVVDLSRKGFTNRSVNKIKRQKSINKIEPKPEEQEHKQFRLFKNTKYSGDFNTIQLQNYYGMQQTIRKRTPSVMTYATVQAQNNMNSLPSSNIDTIQKLYSCMNFDRQYLAKVIESQNYLLRDQIKRNKSNLKQIQNYEIGRQRTSTAFQAGRKKMSKDLFQAKTVLRQIKEGDNNEDEGSQKDLRKCLYNNLSILSRKRGKVKSSCYRRLKQKKISFNNQNSYV